MKSSSGSDMNKETINFSIVLSLIARKNRMLGIEDCTKIPTGIKYGNSFEKLLHQDSYSVGGEK
ncbi:CLUMA_CG010899, isoform A [Clunio marinus]|uniref:CLUMA_CG010899, isoform A n=1 Tax=Clunio marinus TaxID=568069 RepID=A0A1J1IET4_9DIPT|nr:CLUMA_CG010899, isoform A [Clunio marinus]